MFTSHTFCNAALQKLSKKKDTKQKPSIVPPKAPELPILPEKTEINAQVDKLLTTLKGVNNKLTVPATQLRLKTENEKKATVLRKNVKVKELGKVLSVKDGVVRASGLTSVKAGEMVKFVGKSLFGMS